LYNLTSTKIYTMDRKKFFAQLGVGAAALLVPACIGGLAGCEKSSSGNSGGGNNQPSVDFNVDVSTGSLAANGGFLVQNGVLVAKTLTGTFIAVSAACTHQGTTVNYVSSTNSFLCPNHGARFSANGTVTQGPAETNLKQYNTSLTGSTLRVFS
jgi:cytochrome b6-f complex iron-sulfur subunit